MFHNTDTFCLPPLPALPLSVIIYTQLSKSLDDKGTVHVLGLVPDGNRVFSGLVQINFFVTMNTPKRVGAYKPGWVDMIKLRYLLNHVFYVSSIRSVQLARFLCDVGVVGSHIENVGVL